MLPTKTLTSRKEAAAPGYKRGKDRVTVPLCGNAAGTHKLPVMLIGNYAKTRAFKNINVKSLSVHYRASKTAWMNQELFIEWFHSEFVPSVEKHLKSQKLPIKALPVLDNAPSHPSEKELKDGEAVVSTEISTANFLSAIKNLDGCQDVDAEDVEQWLAVDKDLQQETLSGEDIVGTVTDGIQDDDDGDDIVENTTSLISHTDGMKAFEAALFYVEQQSLVSPIDVMLIKKNGETMRQVAELLGFNKKWLLMYFNGM
ncbi:Jerky -like [Araneus ventricosus]|uniref:Jerky-like n=1 Tax=Araneus ventricosus TaxID=182803 RepID=A0A4Y2BTG1_ARAVE|nr:Jerky -like [Araneus ventricosus]